MSDLKKYTVCGTMTISVSTTVKAKSKKEAIRIAQAERVPMRLCRQCSTGNPDEEWVTSGELDGEPTRLEAVEE